VTLLEIPILSLNGAFHKEKKSDNNNNNNLLCVHQIHTGLGTHWI
jgi:hypothetical protein